MTSGRNLTASFLITWIIMLVSLESVKVCKVSIQSRHNYTYRTDCGKNPPFPQSFEIIGYSNLHRDRRWLYFYQFFESVETGTFFIQKNTRFPRHQEVGIILFSTPYNITNSVYILI